MEGLLHLMFQADELISEILAQYGSLTYLILFTIIFIETGLVIVAFFPGDGLLISAGILAATGDLDLSLLLILLSVATILGHTSNYLIGRGLGQRFIKKAKLQQQPYLHKAETYYRKYGGMAVVLSRFFPFFRTLVPFVAGIAKMELVLFTWCNSIGGLLWVSAYLLLGYFFGEIPWVRANYGMVLSVMVILLLVALVVGVLRSLMSKGTDENR